MKKLLLILLLFSIKQTEAQTYVAIPDSNFVHFLKGTVPIAFKGDSLNISSTLVTTTTKHINVSGLNIPNFSGIQYFTSLTYFNCSSCNITSLPTLPNSLDTLLCKDENFNSWPTFPNNITYLDCSTQVSLYSNIPSFPPNLTYLSCGNNHITSLPTLPSSLSFFNCGSNEITSLPTLPNSLTYLNCSSNALTTLPTLPNSLTHLNCSYQLSNANYAFCLLSLPPLPNALTYLDCSMNVLTSLPALSNSLTYLICNHNALTSLPALPNSLTYLNCNYQVNTVSYSYPLLSLPPLPNFLTYLDCSSNALTSLPTLPNSITYLNCGANNIACFPTFPNSITSLHIHSNPFNCLPNYIKVMGLDTITYLLCDSANIYACNVVASNCSTAFTYTVAAGNVGQVNFSIASTGYSNTWHFGDNRSDTSQVGLTAQHFYPNGTYTVQSVTKDSTNQIMCLSTQTITITNSITEIKNNPNQNNIEINIYPNPTNTNFTIETNNTDKQTLQVFDVNGKLVLSQIINGKTNIDASNLTEGVYNLTLINSSGVVNKRLVIVR